MAETSSRWGRQGRCGDPDSATGAWPLTHNTKRSRIGRYVCRCWTNLARVTLIRYLYVVCGRMTQRSSYRSSPSLFVIGDARPLSKTNIIKCKTNVIACKYIQMCKINNQAIFMRIWDNWYLNNIKCNTYFFICPYKIIEFIIESHFRYKYEVICKKF